MKYFNTSTNHYRKYKVTQSLKSYLEANCRKWYFESAGVNNWGDISVKLKTGYCFGESGRHSIQLRNSSSVLRRMKSYGYELHTCNCKECCPDSIEDTKTELVYDFLN